MKYLGLILILGALAGCGGDGGSSAGACANSTLKGIWHLTTGPVLTINSDCTFSTTICHQTGTVSNATSDSGTVTANIKSSNPDPGAVGCLGVGTYQCNYARSGSALVYVCQ